MTKTKKGTKRLKSKTAPGVVPRRSRSVVQTLHEDIAPDGCPDHHFQDGGSWLFDQPQQIPSRWGSGQEVLWAQGEALMLTGSPGTGKTTIAGQLVRALLGLQDTVLGYPVTPAHRVLYLAMDRPRQIARAFARLFRPEDRSVAADRLVPWEGPPPADLARNTNLLRDMARAAGADVVIVDSLKDAVVGLAEDEVGAMWNRARQTAIADGIDVLELHHLVKRSAGGGTPTSLPDVYGSAWLTAGAGSVLLIVGEAGESLVELRHLKSVAEVLPPLKLEHDHQTGTTRVIDDTDPLTVLRASQTGMTATELAAVLYASDKPSSGQVQKVRRTLDRLERDGDAVLLGEESRPRGGRPQKRFRATTEANTFEFQRDATTVPESNHARRISAGRATTRATTATTTSPTTSSHPPERGGGRRKVKRRARSKGTQSNGI